LALAAGKPVYVEKPMTLDSAGAARLHALAQQHNDSVVVAHYRRNWPKYKKVKQLLDKDAIGKPVSANLQYFRALLTAEEMLQPGVQWRIDPAISGGGLFHDLAPHQLDLFLYWLGDVFHAAGTSMNVGGLYDAPDMVSGTLEFESGVSFTGEWCFCAQDNHQKDQWEIVGEKGRISGSVFWEADIELENENEIQTFSFEPAEHNQIYHIEEVVKFFRGEAPNPCSTLDGLKVMQWMDAFSGL
jgi:predicted dehydrogenase